MTSEDRTRRRSRLALGALLLGAGTMHFVNPRFFDPLVPEALPGTQRAWTYGSGVAELVAGGLLVNGRTNRAGAWTALAVFIGVWPGNLHDTISNPPTDARGVASLVRLPLQIPLILWAWRHTRDGSEAATAVSD